MHFNEAKRLLRSHGFEVEKYNCSAGGYGFTGGEYLVHNPETFESYKLFTDGIKKAGDLLMQLTGGNPPANCPKAPARDTSQDGWKPL